MVVERRADFVIVGGAIIGSAAATFLAMRPDWSGSIKVVERDLTYRTASTTLSAASIRLQFSTPLNIEISRFGVEFLRNLDRWLGVDGAPQPVADFIEGGYLFLATEAGMPTLLANHAVQREHGVEAELLDPDALRRRFGWLRTDDLAGGSLGLSGEGWFDAHALLQSFRRKARSLGVEYVAGAVTGIGVRGSRVEGVRLADGTRIETGLVLNAAGPRAAEVATMAGLELPVHPRKRHLYHFDCRERIGRTPLTIAPSGVYFRPEGDAWLAGYSPHDGEPDPDTLDLEPDRAFFDDFVWPDLAARVPAFESVRLLDTWAGHYEVNSLDHNAIIGPHPEVAGFLFANGFSGHGLQQAPAVGRGLAELIACGRYETLDLSPLGYERIRSGQPIRELNVV
jgi:FAD-dependent oxidoreductase domain-containing protein 1